MSAKRTSEKRAVELVEEAVHFLRLAPLNVLVSYLIGTLPFVLGFLYFWSDMSRSAFAAGRCAESSLMIALLFLWMKYWQSIFASGLKEWICGNASPHWKLRAALRTVPAQTLIHATGWITLPVAALILLPFGWAYAFYQNVLVVSAKNESGLLAISRNAMQQATLWPKQNHAALLILNVCALFVFLNIVSAIIMVPVLMKMLLGIETSFTQSLSAFLNTTFLMTAFALTYLCVDPLIKAVYTLRCFYGESIQTGEDLRSELRLTGAPGLKTAALVLVSFSMLTGSIMAQSETESSPAPYSVNSAELDQSIRDVLHSSEFSWRIPRETADDDGTGLFGRKIEAWLRSLGGSVENFFDWLFNRGRFQTPPTPGSQGSWLDWATTVRGLVIILSIALAALLIAWVFRAWRRHLGEKVQWEAVAVTPIPDLENDDVTAADLPEDDWLKLAAEMFEQGETRLALRALYLSTLAHLSRRQLITITRSKSNLDYERELRRRAHALPDTLSAFSENVAIIDRVWYGMYAVTEEIIEQFSTNRKQIQQA